MIFYRDMSKAQIARLLKDFFKWDENQIQEFNDWRDQRNKEMVMEEVKALVTTEANPYDTWMRMIEREGWKYFSLDKSDQRPLFDYELNKPVDEYKLYRQHLMRFMNVSDPPSEQHGFYRFRPDGEVEFAFGKTINSVLIYKLNQLLAVQPDHSHIHPLEQGQPPAQ